MKNFFPPKKNFKSLSVVDLLEAREAYHAHLINKENVVATAIGFYRLRKDDPDRKEPMDYDTVKDTMIETPRTLENTVVQPWSWPCLLVFVKNWVTKKDRNKLAPDQVVPSFLYMPDGRMIPTCVIYSKKQKEAAAPLQDIDFPHEIIGGGYPVFTDEQGERHVGSIGCMVTDGNSVFALTNRHITGDAGREIYSYLGGERLRIGTSHEKQLGKKPFQDVYPGWPGRHTYSNLDAGLIYVDDVANWTAQVFGIGELDAPVDLNTQTISLDLIGCPVRAFGAASGELNGEIKALFYRYKSIGGFEYVSDLLIGPRDGSHPLATRPGDSGTLWVYDEGLSPKNSREADRSGLRARRFRPIALQWGGNILKGDNHGSGLRFALATCLSTICRELDMDIISKWNVGLSEYWGKTGHYKIAATACDLVTDRKLKKLLSANKSVIAFSDQAIEAGDLKKIDAKQFVPLADVPDYVWRTYRKKDAVSHFADMDEEGRGNYKGKTLLALSAKKSNIDIDVWNRFYDSLDFKSKERGALPFRVWQIYSQMVNFVRESNISRFVCAGGVLSHYIADACQPLHISRLHHGNPGKKKEKPVHSKYENDMLDRYALDVIAGINAKFQRSRRRLKKISDGHEAAALTVRLMRQTLKTLPPEDIIDAFNHSSGRKRIPHMFDTLGKRTISCMAEGCILLASLWNSAWKEGGGDKINKNRLHGVSRTTLKNIYNDKKFLPAFYVTDEEYKNELK